MKKGDIVLVPFPFTDLTGVKNRPALVLVSGDHDVTLSFITTQVKWQEEFDVRIEPSPENGLKKKSLIRLSKLTTLEKGLIIGKLGFLPIAELEQVDRGLIQLFKLKTAVS